VLVEMRGEVQRLAEADVHPAEPLAQLGQRAQQPEHGLLLLRPPGQLADVGLLLEQSLVAEVHGDEHDRPARVLQETADRHLQHAGLRREQAPGAAAAALDEVLDRVAALHQHLQVGGEHLWIERIALERAAQEERAALPQEPPDHRQVQVHAGRHVRHREAAVVDHVGQQQVVHVAAVARHVDDLRALARGLEPLGVQHLDAVVELRPQSGQQHVHEADEAVRVVGGDLHRVATRDLERFAAAEVPVPHLLRGGDAHAALHQRLGDHRAAVGEVRADRRRAHRAELVPHRAGDPAHGAARLETRPGELR
jgi:hypothetical protein